MPSFKIAIPTHRRAATLVKKTLAFLAEHLIPPEIIYLFVETEEIPDYLAALPADYMPRIVPGLPGTRGQRTAIEEYFLLGTRLVCLDDDVIGIKVLDHPEFDLIDLLEECFENADENGCSLWGFHPSDNALSMKPKTVVGLKYIIGAFFGMTLKYRLDYPSNLTEDFERTIQYYLRDGCVMRFENVGIRTKYFAAGGLQEHRLGDAQEYEMVAFANRFPELCRLRRRLSHPTDVVVRSIKLSEFHLPG